MSNCCFCDCLYLGCYLACSTFQLKNSITNEDYLAPESGQFLIVIKYPGVKSRRVYAINFQEGDQLELNTGIFNEIGVSKFEIYKPSGELYITPDNITCFEVRITPTQ
jgi:hypothetical protein